MKKPREWWLCESCYTGSTYKPPMCLMCPGKKFIHVVKVHPQRTKKARKK